MYIDVLQPYKSKKIPNITLNNKPEKPFIKMIIIRFATILKITDEIDNIHQTRLLWYLNATINFPHSD